LLNLRKIEATARTNTALAVAMSIVIVAVLVATVRYLLAGPAMTLRRFHPPLLRPRNIQRRRRRSGTSLAVLTYIGFDGISTLSEEVNDPRRNIPVRWCWSA
jgi:putrescine importer